ncbi:MAG: hypothetical protein H7288_10240 [Kineosporiaceae bacterium]|nr:hypothetical protein [Aeromicrobium sp.]
MRRGAAVLIVARRTMVWLHRQGSAQGVAGPGQLTYDKSIDFIRSTTAGVVGIRPIDWQNRPASQQVVDYRTHRAR